MAIARRQGRSTEAAADSTNGLPLDGSFHGLVFNSTTNVAGSVFIAAVYWQSGTATMACSSHVNGAMTAIGSPIRGTGNLAGWSFQCFFVANPSSTGNDTINATPSANCTVGLHIDEYSGFVSTPTLNGTPAYNEAAAAANPAVSSAITTTVATALIYSACFCATSATGFHTGGAFTDRSGGGDSNWGAGVYGDDIVSTTQSGLTASIDNNGGETEVAIFAISDGGGAASTSYSFRRRSDAHLLAR